MKLAVVFPALALVLASAWRAGPPALQQAVRSDTTTITIVTTNAGLAFNPDEVSVKAGAPVRIRYVNESGMSHNLVILKDEKDFDAIGVASFEADHTGFVPMKYKDRLVGFSPLATAGKTVEFVFVAPAAGDYPFACFVDGHFNTMVGKLRTN
jgi:uncharacterized cupredoxin-like copper-binding protein